MKNVIISNLNNNFFEYLNIEVVDKKEGIFTVDEIINMYANYVYDRLIIDISCIKDYANIKEIAKLATNLDSSKIILILNDDKKVMNVEYINALINMGIYNFTKNKNVLLDLIKLPNSFNEVSYLLNNKDMFSDKVFIDEKLETVINEEVEIHDVKPKIIGFKKATSEAGATTLIYLMHSYLSTKTDVISVEVDKNDFSIYKKDNMIKCSNDELNNVINSNNDKKIMLIDLNKSNNYEICDEIIYLIEVSKIKLGKLLFSNINGLEELKDKKVILNKSILTEDLISTFEKNSGIKMMYKVPPLNDYYINNYEIEKLCEYLNLN